MAIREGTTPTHTFVLPFSTDVLKCVRIVYAQCNEVLFVRTNGDVTLEGNIVKTTLTQEETFMFDRTKLVEIQIRALTYDDDALASEPILVSVAKCLEKEVLV